ncbi:universal stress protein [Natrinema sp. CBA1119]
MTGSHDRTRASRVLLESVAEKITRRSPVPVTSVF